MENKDNNLIVGQTIEDIMNEIIEQEGTDDQKMSVFLYALCDNNMELYYRTIDLLATVDKFKNKLTKNGK